MAESIDFEGIFGGELRESHTITTASGKVWNVTDQWFMQSNKMVQNITISNEDVESYYYVDLEVSDVKESVRKISKSVRMLSSSILFEITADEYVCFGVKLGVPLTYNCKVILAPIFQFMNIQIPPDKLKKLKKRTKIDLLGGLKDLSDNMSKMLSNANVDTLKYSDVLLRCGSKELVAHRNVLSARSKLFRRMFCKLSHKNGSVSRNELKGLNAHVFDDDSDEHSKFQLKPDCRPFFVAELTNIEPEDFENFVHFLYTGKGKIENYRKAKYLFGVARAYGVRDLERKCILKLKSEESADAQFEIYHFALKHRQEMLKRKVMDRVASEIIEHQMQEARKRKWMAIFESYQKPFFEDVAKKARQHMPIGIYDPSEHADPNVVGNEVRNNFAVNQYNVTNRVHNNDIYSGILNDIKNVRSHGGAKVGYYLYGTAYFDTRDAPKEFDNSNPANDSFEVTKDPDYTKNAYDNGTKLGVNVNITNDGKNSNGNSDLSANVPRQMKEKCEDDTCISDIKNTSTGTKLKDNINKADAKEFPVNKIVNEENDVDSDGNDANDVDSDGNDANDFDSDVNDVDSDANNVDSDANNVNSHTNDVDSYTNDVDSEANDVYSDTNDVDSDENDDSDANEVDINDAKELDTNKTSVESDEDDIDNVFDEDDPIIKYILEDICRIINM